MARTLARVLTLLLLASCGTPDGPAVDSGPVPDAGPRCEDDGECDDGEFCTGVERCAPGSSRADDFGCLEGVPPCSGGDACDESADSCGGCTTDADGDGSLAASCGGTDCDDADAARHPGATEICDAIDQDCDPATVGDRDADSDDHVDAACCNGALCGDDCDDARADVYGGLVEACDARDNDCDGATDEGVLRSFYPDADGDGFGDREGTATLGCTLPSGSSESATDCDDDRADAHPGAIELCNGLDDDCFSATGTEAAEDADGDGHSWVAAPCTLGTLPRDDCNDGLANAYPGAPELCNGLDDDCSAGGGADLREDLDGDGHAPLDAACTGGPLMRDDCDDDARRVHPGATETCDATDEDCSGLADDEPGASAACAAGLRCIAGACDGAPVELARGYVATCARLASGAVVCWGNDELGTLGSGATGPPRTQPSRVVMLSDARDLAMGVLHACALRATGETACWGYGAYGQLGNGLLVDRSRPYSALTIRRDAVAVMAGLFHTCLRYPGTTDQMECWGNNDGGQIGDGGRTARSTPTRVRGLPAETIVDAAGGLGHTCAVTSSGALWCWGHGPELGLPGVSDTTVPTRVPGISGVTSVCAGVSHTCALSGGRAWCWGQIAIGQPDPNVPAMVSGADMLVELECGDEYACGRRASGELFCWGSNNRGALGTGDRTGRTTAVAVTGVTDASALSSGAGGHTCALRTGGAAWCWGYNDQGQLGDGTMTDRLTPTAVLDLP